MKKTQIAMWILAVFLCISMTAVYLRTVNHYQTITKNFYSQEPTTHVQLVYWWAVLRELFTTGSLVPLFLCGYIACLEYKFKKLEDGRR